MSLVLLMINEDQARQLGIKRELSPLYMMWTVELLIREYPIGRRGRNQP